MKNSGMYHHDFLKEYYQFIKKNTFMSFPKTIPVVKRSVCVCVGVELPQFTLYSVFFFSFHNRYLRLIRLVLCYCSICFPESAGESFAFCFHLAIFNMRLVS